MGELLLEQMYCIIWILKCKLLQIYTEINFHLYKV